VLPGNGFGTGDDVSIIDGRRKQISDSIAVMPEIIAKVYAKGDFRRIGFNVESAVRLLFQRAMMSARVDGDFQSARRDFALAASFIPEFERALDQIRQSGQKPVPPLFYNCLDIQSFELPMFACVLAHDWTSAELLARMTRDPNVLQIEDETNAQVSRLLAAFVLDEQESFTSAKRAYDKIKKRAWSKYFLHYFEMYDSVVNRNQARYDELASSADMLYRARAKDRKFGDLRPEYGGLADNERMLDFIALAIAIVAVKRGMRPGKESDVVPAALISEE
jgi:hypothetical protein